MKERNSEGILYVRVALLFLEGRCNAGVSPQTPPAPAEKVQGISRLDSLCRAQWRRVSRNLHNGRIFQDLCWISVIRAPCWKCSMSYSSLWDLLITWSNQAVELTDDAAAGGSEVRLVVHALIDQISQLSPLGRRQLLETLIKLLLLQNTQTFLPLFSTLICLKCPFWCQETWTFCSDYSEIWKEVPCPDPSRAEGCSRCWRAPTAWRQSSTYHTPESCYQGTSAPPAPPKESCQRPLKKQPRVTLSVANSANAATQGTFRGLTIFPQHRHADSRVAQLDEGRDALRWVAFSDQQQVFGTDVSMNDIILLLQERQKEYSNKYSTSKADYVTVDQQQDGLGGGVVVESIQLTRKFSTDASCLATSSFQLTDTDLPLFR